jgi:hypothetical protein
MTATGGLFQFDDYLDGSVAFIPDHQPHTSNIAIHVQYSNTVRQRNSCVYVSVLFPTMVVFMLRQLIRKSREYNYETPMRFIDYIKESDRELRSKLWDIMEMKGYPEYLIQVM